MSASPDRPIFALFEVLSAQPVKAGEVVAGVIQRIDDDVVTVRVGEVDGRLPRAELGAAMVGESLDVYVDEVGADGVVLSRDKARRLALSEQLKQAAADQTILTATVHATTRGGLAVSVLGVKALLPSRRLGPGAGRLVEWIGREVPVRVVKLDGRRVEVAHADLGRAEPVVQAENAGEPLPTRTLADIEPEQVIEGNVVRLTKFGAFVDLGGVDGLIALTELDRGRVTRPGEVVRVGERLAVKVLAVDAEKGRVSLSRKALQADPWDGVAERFAPGTRVSGTVVGLAEYGAFVAVAPGLEGLVHLSELAWGATPKDARGVVKVGQAVDVEVLELDAERRRLKLSIKRTAANPWETLHDTYPPGTRLRGPVRSVTDFGAFVGVAEGVDGLVHVSDMEWGQTVRDPRARFKKGQQIEVMVLQVDVERQRLSLGIKQLIEDPRPALYAKLELGAELDGEVSRVVDFGVFVALPDGLEGLLHRTALGDRQPAVGETIGVQVLGIDPEEGRIALGLGSQVVAEPAEQAAPVEAAAEEAAAEEAAEPAAEETPAEEPEG